MKISNKLARLAALAVLALGGAASAPAYVFLVDDASGLPTKWPAGNVAVRIQLGDTPALSDGTNYNTSAQAATQEWNAKIGSLVFTTTFGPAGEGVDHNGINEIFFSATYYGKEFPDAVAIAPYWRSGTRRTECDIIFNTEYVYDAYRGPLRVRSGAWLFDLHRIALHELGHSLGLNHPNEAGQNIPSVMNVPADKNTDYLTDDDISGAQALYGPPGVPANDSFANATPLTLGADRTFSVTGVNTNAGKESGEPNHAGNSGGHSVWYKFTAPVSGGATLDTRGSYFDTVLAVYTGSAVGSLALVAANDDTTPSTALTSKATFFVQNGTTYYVAVDGSAGNSGGFTLAMALDPNAVVAPTITTQPLPLSINSGGSGTFSVAANGSEPLAYQWKFGGSPIANATSASYSINNATLAQAGTYSVTISNSAGSITSNGATLSVTTPPPPPPAPSGGGGGGGGAPSLWFCAALAVLGFGRLFQRARR